MTLERDFIAVSGAPPSWNLEPFCLKLAKALRRGRFVTSKSRVVLSVSCVDTATMKTMNRRYRRVNDATDVLSFEQPRVKAQKKLPGLVPLGDLVLCIPVVRIQAVQMKHSVHDEMAILLVHGVLHLLGYDHEKSSKESVRMGKAEGKLLGLLGFGVRIQSSGLISRTKVKESA